MSLEKDDAAAFTGQRPRRRLRGRGHRRIRRSSHDSENFRIRISVDAYIIYKYVYELLHMGMYKLYTSWSHVHIVL